MSPTNLGEADAGRREGTTHERLSVPREYDRPVRCGRCVPHGAVISYGSIHQVITRRLVTRIKTPGSRVTSCNPLRSLVRTVTTRARLRLG